MSDIFEQALVEMVEDRLLDLHTCFPGTVLRTSDQLADVRCAAFTLTGIPVASLRAGGLHIHMPLAAGDRVVVFCSETSLASWRKGGAREADPQRHTLAGAFCMPMLWPDGQGLDAHATKITLGGTVSAPARADKIETELQRIKAELQTLKAATQAGLGGVPAVGSTLSSTFAAATVAVGSAPGDTSASKVVCE